MHPPVDYSNVIDLKSVTKLYSDRAVLDSVTLRVPRGSIFGFVGPNGAGKTTTIKAILGLVTPTSGSIFAFGLDVAHHRTRVAKNFGAVIGGAGAYYQLTGEENIAVAAKLRGLPSSECGRVLQVVGLGSDGNRLVRKYSTGMRQRLAIARSLLGNPPLLILDEPTNGLDQEGIVEIRSVLKMLNTAEGTTVFISSHLLSELDQLVDHIALMRHGRILTQGSLEELASQGRRTIVLSGSDPDAMGRALSVSKISFRREGAYEIHVDIERSDVLEHATSRIAKAVLDFGSQFSGIRVLGGRIEELYSLDEGSNVEK